MIQVFVTLGETQFVWNVCRQWSIDSFITNLSGHIARKALAPLFRLELLRPEREVLLYKTMSGKQFRPTDKINDLLSVHKDDNIWVLSRAQVYPLVGYE